MAFDLIQAVRAAGLGDELRVPAGTYAVNLDLPRSLTLVADGPVTIDAGRKGPGLRIAGNGEVKVVGFTFVNGDGESGGGVFHGGGRLQLRDCRFEENHAPGYGGGGLYTSGTSCEVLACQFLGNHGGQGGAILADRLVKLTLRDTLLAQNASLEGGALRVREGAQVELVGCTLADNRAPGEGSRGSAIFCSGTMSRTPKVSLVNCIVTEREKGPALIDNAARHPADLTVRRCLLSESARALGGDNLFRDDPRFFSTGTTPYALQPTSPAANAADVAAYGPQGKDLLGQLRIHGGRAELGAFAIHA